MIDKVGLVLSRNSEARDSDQDLYIDYMTTFHKDSVYFEEGRYFIEVKDGLPQQQDIARIRRKYHENGKYLGSDEVMARRMASAKNYNSQLGTILDLVKDQIRG